MARLSGREVRILANETAEKNGVNNSTGKADTYVNKMYSLFKETLLDEEGLNKVLQREWDKMHSKDNKNKVLDKAIKNLDRGTPEKIIFTKQTLYDYIDGSNNIYEDSVLEYGKSRADKVLEVVGKRVMIKAGATAKMIDDDYAVEVTFSNGVSLDFIDVGKFVRSGAIKIIK